MAQDDCNLPPRSRIDSIPLCRDYNLRIRADQLPVLHVPLTFPSLVLHM